MLDIKSASQNRIFSDSRLLCYVRDRAEDRLGVFADFKPQWSFGAVLMDLR